ncbi:methionine ABC transporter ATP-binding protein [Campylobacter californiensis]|uniref:methionine ABC transporter ATP-binding protein n=1 Tax=Campylobacter californiensis TaxID=1032243 RepID=UPI002150520A|nr:MULTISPECIES: ATP-binding cassette domain-containing protein [unclassified Campylobacter]
MKDGEIYGLVERSGAGKSTLLRCMNGLEVFDEGELNIGGVDVNKLNKEELRKFRKGVGMIFQQTSILERKTVYENIAFPMQCWDVSKSEQDAKIRELVKLVELEDKLHVKAQNLSGGQKQRVAIARSLTLNPTILLCDEATSALDPNTTKNILALLSKINKQLNITIVVVTHEMSVVREICTKVAILEHGKIVQKGDPSDVFMSESEALNRLLGSTPYLLKEAAINLEIILNLGTQQATILSNLARDLNLNYEITDGKVEHFRTRSFTKMVLSFDEARLNQVKNYLDKNDISYKILSKEEL